ncbi:hypothetical protein PIIN_11812 [Serendipita indica DSM 11827]|uniref:Protein kinase domain-containing protein n=1 Tax=Serendipita indica (strain DSM 11827) TaxID=1109443 RepID=G4TZU3_SERID|nr:hypothetical protein PIIN_11812 [Serendipita indica DSM 11827]
MLLNTDRLPMVIMEIAGEDEYKMMLQAGALLRMAHYLKYDELIVTAIYISNDFIATRYLFCLSDPKSKQVVYTKDRFILTEGRDLFEMVLELYNLMALSKQQSSNLSQDKIKLMTATVNAKNFPKMTGTPRASKRTREDDRTNPSGKRINTNQGGTDRMNERIINAGYALAWHHLPQDGKDIFELLFPFPDNVREATRRDGLSVIIKRVKHRSEVDILRYLESRGGVNDHIIALLDVLEFDVQWLIVMPKHVRLREATHLLSTSSAVYSFQKQFLQGVAFMHANGVAHLDLKPDNVVVDFGKRSRDKDQGTLYIIDFGVAEMTVTTSTTMKDLCGTYGWTAPDIQDGQTWSPILADRWACGKVLLYIGEQIKLDLP